MNSEKRKMNVRTKVQVEGWRLAFGGEKQKLKARMRSKFEAES
jgi:hypothetical protein